MVHHLHGALLTVAVAVAVAVSSAAAAFTVIVITLAYGVGNAAAVLPSALSAPWLPVQGLCHFARGATTVNSAGTGAVIGCRGSLHKRHEAPA